MSRALIPLRNEEFDFLDFPHTAQRLPSGVMKLMANILRRVKATVSPVIHSIFSIGH